LGDWCRWEDDIEMNLKGTGYEDVEWIHLAQDRNQWLALVSTPSLLNS